MGLVEHAKEELIGFIQGRTWLSQAPSWTIWAIVFFGVMTILSTIRGFALDFQLKPKLEHLFSMSDPGCFRQNTPMRLQQ